MIDWQPAAAPPAVPAVDRPVSLAVHTLFVDDLILAQAIEGRFDTIVQVLPWYVVEPARNRFDWREADRLVEAVTAHNLNLVLRLDMPPPWASAPDDFGFPFDLRGYLRFVTAVADRYRGHVAGYIIWNEPNLAAEWSFSGQNLIFHYDLGAGRVAAPAEYAGLLGAAYRQIKRADPQALVVTAGMAPTNENSGRAMDDRRFLDQLLLTTGGRCFDILGVHIYDFGGDPLAPYEEDAIALARVEDLLALASAHQVDRPLWITEMGYTVDSPYHPMVSREEQARYLVTAVERIQTDWPEITMVTIWNLSYGPGVEEEMAGYSLLESADRERPALAAIREFSARR